MKTLIASIAAAIAGFTSLGVAADKAIQDRKVQSCNLPCYVNLPTGVQEDEVTIDFVGGKTFRDHRPRVFVLPNRP